MGQLSRSLRLWCVSDVDHNDVLFVKMCVLIRINLQLSLWLDQLGLRKKGESKRGNTQIKNIQQRSGASPLTRSLERVFPKMFHENISFLLKFCSKLNKALLWTVLRGKYGLCVGEKKRKICNWIQLKIHMTQEHREKSNPPFRNWC